MAAGITTGEGCVEQSYPFPKKIIQRIMSTPEIGAKTSALVHDGVMKCIGGTFLQADFKNSQEKIGSEAKYVNIVCEDGPKAEIHIGKPSKGRCTNSFETSNGTDYIMGKTHCATGN